MSALTQHPLFAAFPAMSPQELSDLTDDIAAHGLRQPLVNFAGPVLDGWHRYQACQHAEIKPDLVAFDGDDPIAFVMSLNAQRRHLTASQRAGAAAKASAWKPSGAQAVTAKGEPGSPPRSNEELAALAKTTTRTIQQAKRAIEAGLGEPVIDGKVSAKTAAAVAALPAKERAKVTAAPPEEWQEKLARKSPRNETPAPSPEEQEQLDDAHERMADLASDYESLLRIVEADDKLGEARAIIKEQRAKYEQLERLYEAQRRELAEMTKEAKRWKRKAEAKEAA